MKDIFDTKVNVELTLGELENIILCLRAINKHNTGSVRSKLEERLSNLSVDVKMGQSFENTNKWRERYGAWIKDITWIFWSSFRWN